MTKLILKFMTICLLAVNSVHATDGKILPLDKNSVIISFEGWNTNHVEIKFFDQLGKELFVEKLNTKNITAKKYNLKKLIPGNYKITISDDVKQAERKIMFQDSGILLSEETNMIYKPFFEQKDDKVMINQLILGNAAKIQIMDDANNVLHEEFVLGENTIAKTFNVDQLPAGYYSFVIQTQGKMFQKTFFL